MTKLRMTNPQFEITKTNDETQYCRERCFGFRDSVIRLFFRASCHLRILPTRAAVDITDLKE